MPQLVHKEAPGASIPEGVENWGSLRRKSYALTRVCRQIRKEFLPLYSKEVKVRVNIEALHHYLTDVVQNAGTDPKCAYGNISIDITKECSVDLQEILLLHDRAPNLHLSFTVPERESDMMSILLDADRWPQFHAFVAEKTSHVMLYIYFDDFYECGFNCGFFTGRDTEFETNDWRPDETDDRPDETYDRPDETYHRPDETYRRPDETYDSPDETYDRLRKDGVYPYTQSCTLFVKEEFAEMWMEKSWHGSPRWLDGLYRWEADLGLKDRKKVRCVIRPEA